MKKLFQWAFDNKSKPAPKQLQQSLEELERNENKPPTLDHTVEEFKDCADIVHRSYREPQQLDLIYFGYLVNEDKLNRDIIQPMLKSGTPVPEMLEQAQCVLAQDSKTFIKGILAGHAAIFHEGKAYLLDVASPPARTIEQSETETVITGPHEGFTEQASVSLSLIRKRLQSSHLKVIKRSVGEIAKSDVYILYIKDIVNMDYVDELLERVSGIEIDAVHDLNMLVQLIDDSPSSIFPQFLTSERPDAIASKLVSGRVVCLMDGSPSVLSAPTSFFEFFSSSDDYYQRWMLGTATRMLRLIAFMITISFTALYVAVTTFHYEMIPEDLLLPLSESRSRVPFPPVFEALLMETTIELLREAGARLPTKIGQTIGIVGGIVIGQAAVQAGLTSNILIISVAASAISSFVIPSYVMSASFRLIRFGLILLAGLWGNLGLAMGFVAIVIHLCGLTSLGTSYITPVAPSQPKDWKDVFIRAPFGLLKSRPTQARTPNPVRQRIRK